MFTVNSKNAMLDALTITHASAHSGFPGATGGNEIFGTGYGRQAVVFGSASAGVRQLGSGINFTIPSGSTVRWMGLWNNTTFVGYAPNAGIPMEFQCDPSTDVIRCPTHGFVDTNKVVFFGDTVPGGLVEGTIYYVIAATADTFKVSASSGGSAIDLTSAGGSACVVSSITEEEYASGGTHTVASWTLGLPN